MPDAWFNTTAIELWPIRASGSIRRRSWPGAVSMTGRAAQRVRPRGRRQVAGDKRASEA